jgi:hypothetical protein
MRHGAASAIDSLVTNQAPANSAVTKMEYAFILSLLRWTMPSVFNHNDTLVAMKPDDRSTAITSTAEI